MPGEQSPGRFAFRHSLGAMFPWRRTALRRRVIVNLKTSKAIAGVLYAKRGPLLELRDASLLEAGRPPVPVDGTVVVERSNVDFLQVLAPPAVPAPVAEEG